MQDSESPEVVSPASWHVAFWILACLCISSMSQPRERFCFSTAKFRVYLVSSPILCATDTFSTVIRFFWALYRLNGDVRIASQFAISPGSVFEKRKSAADNEAADQKDTLESDNMAGTSWPRILLFLIGTFPATIKLAALGGVPWTKVWGMMFVTNFIVRESISLLFYMTNPVDESNPTDKDDWTHQDVAAYVVNLSHDDFLADIAGYRQGQDTQQTQNQDSQPNGLVISAIQDLVLIYATLLYYITMLNIVLKSIRTGSIDETGSARETDSTYEPNSTRETSPTRETNSVHETDSIDETGSTGETGSVRETDSIDETNSIDVTDLVREMDSTRKTGSTRATNPTQEDNLAHKETIASSTSEQETQTQSRRNRLNSLVLFPYLDLVLMLFAILIHICLLIFIVSTVWMNGINSVWGKPSMHHIRFLVSSVKGVLGTCLILYTAWIVTLFAFGRLSRGQLSRAFKFLCLWSLIIMDAFPRIPVGGEMAVEDIPPSYTQPSWMDSIDNFWNSLQVNVVEVMTSGLLITIIGGSFLFITTSVVFYFAGWHSKDSLLYSIQIFLIGLFVGLMFPQLPDARRYHRERTLGNQALGETAVSVSKVTLYMSLWGFLCTVLLLLHMSMIAISRRWPRIARALLIGPKNQDTNKEAKTRPNLIGSGAIDPVGCCALYLFISNVSACALWYAFKYDPDGTFNPPWTEVFG